jgi:subtilisin family serine protease
LQDRRAPTARIAFDSDDSSHGTHVAGIAAGNAQTRVGGGRVVSGVAPRAYIGNYKVFVETDTGLSPNANSPAIVAAIEAAVADGMDVINFSGGEPEIEPSRDVVALALDAAAAAGVVPVISAGNDYTDVGAGSVSSPANSARALAVGAVEISGSPARREHAEFSSVGPTTISLQLKPDVAAPGVDVLSSVPGGWGSYSGTSMAAPHVAGAAALLAQRHPEWTVADRVRSRVNVAGLRRQAVLTFSVKPGRHVCAGQGGCPRSASPRPCRSGCWRGVAPRATVRPTTPAAEQDGRSATRAWGRQSPRSARPAADGRCP